MKELEWALKIAEEGYKSLLKQYHPDRVPASERPRADETCRRLAVARDELNALVEATKYDVQFDGQQQPVPGPIPGPPIFSPHTREETVKRILDIAEVLIFGPKGRRRPRSPRRPMR